MSKLGAWSTTAGSNNATPPDGWPEGQAPSTVNDCAREMMASIRTVFNDAQWFDQNLTPTYVAATQFSVAGDQTSAIHIGRRLKIFDATAGVATVLYATVVSVSFTAVTNIHISADAGQLTSSLSSFAIAILSSNNNSLPRAGTIHTDKLSASSIQATQLSSIAIFVNNTLTASATFTNTSYVNNTLTVGGTIVAAQVAKVFGRFFLSAGGVVTGSLFNVATVSRSATGAVRLTYTNAFVDNNYVIIVNPFAGNAVSPSDLSLGAAACEFVFRNSNGSAVDEVLFMVAAFRV